ncbi:hypothetical protein PG985_001928 [Apiospora marii]|uniref:Uncharacterized protein n=1 Tax=Apiospora marii TaxID=335849 RepID=A0ABR1S1C3_9PEZI
MTSTSRGNKTNTWSTKLASDPTSSFWTTNYLFIAQHTPIPSYQRDETRRDGQRLTLLHSRRGQAWRQLVPELMNVDEKEDYWQPYYLAETRQGPSEGGQPFREHLAAGEPFANDFLGASVEECGAFELAQQDKDDLTEDCRMVLLDARSARDKTVLVCYYVRPVYAFMMRRDQKGEAWYTFRVPYTRVAKLCSYFPPVGDADETWGAIFHRKEELTDEQGVFDVERASELCVQGEGDVPGLEDLDDTN